VCRIEVKAADTALVDFFNAEPEAAGEVCACGRINPGKIRPG
jgi:hypothetical protein